MINLGEAIKASKRMLDQEYSIYDVSYFKEYTPCYFFTTENIREYLKRINHDIDKALTVIGSGDQIFNLLVKGAKSIDAFDINKLTFYNYHLKQAFIMSLTYEEFFENNNNGWNLYSPDAFANFLEKIKGNMPKDVYLYYKAVLEYGIKNCAFRTFINGFGDNYNEKMNLYANSKENYQKLQRAIENTSISFCFDDVRSIPLKFCEGYDIILLSNIADYLEDTIVKEKFKNYIASFYNLLNKDGTIINYFYTRGLFSPLILSSNVYASDLGEENVFKVPDTNQSYYLLRKK